MSFKSELNRTVSLLRTARNAILGRGGEISATAGLKDLPNAIFNIPADASLAFQTDDDIAFRKIVPVGAEEYAQITRIGGMTRKSINLVPPNTVVQTVNGFTITPLEDGRISVTGSATEAKLTTIELALVTKSGITPLALLPNVEYQHRFRKDGVHITGVGIRINYTDEQGGGIWGWEAQDITRPRNISKIYYEWNTEVGDTRPCGIYSVMIYDKKYYPVDEYQPYFEGLRDTAVTALKSEGVNRFNFNAPLRASEQAYLTVIDNDTFTVTTKIATTGTAYNYISWEDIKIPKGATKLYIKVTATPTGKLTKGRFFARYRDASGTLGDTLQRDGKGELTVSHSIPSTNRDGDSYIRITWYVVSGDVSDAGDYIEYKNAMVSFDVDAPYTRYVGTLDTFEIPEAVKSLDGYGRGVNDTYHNYIEWRNGRAYFVQNTYIKVFDGTEEWIASTTSTGQGDNLVRLRYVLSPSAYGAGNSFVSPFICTLYDEITSEATWYSKTGVAVSNKNELFVCDPRYQAVSAWKAHLAELYANGTPLIVEYVLAEPIETDITDLLRENFLKVQGGGTNTAHNDYEYYAPSTINYITKVGG